MTPLQKLRLIGRELSGIDLDDLTTAERKILNIIDMPLTIKCDHSTIFQYRKPKSKLVSCKKCEEN